MSIFSVEEKLYRRPKKWGFWRRILFEGTCFSLDDTTGLYLSKNGNVLKYDYSKEKNILNISGRSESDEVWITPDEGPIMVLYDDGSIKKFEVVPDEYGFAELKEI